MRKYPEKGETEEEYTKNRAKRIDVGHFYLFIYQIQSKDNCIQYLTATQNIYI